MKKEIEVEMEDEQDYEYEEETLASSLQQEFKAAPWYLSSFGAHCIFAIFMMLFMTPQVKAEPKERIVITTDIVETLPEDKTEPEKDIVIDKPEIVDPKITSTEVTEVKMISTTNIEVADHMETDDNMDKNSALGEQDNISDVDSEFKGVPSIMGVGNSGGGGGGGKYGWRDGGGNKNKKLRDGGGDPRTESAVDWALRWLAAHQESDGHWDCKKYGGGGHDAAITGLSLLAFLGAGNSCTAGKFKDNVARATEWLASKIDANGCIGPYRYEAPIATMALVESYGMGANKYEAVAQKAVDYIVASQCATGGWDYAPKSTRTDTSVSGWAVMCLKSAKISYLKVPDSAFNKAKEYFQKATTPEGDSTSYASTGGEIKNGGGSERMTAVALSCLQFLGVSRDDAQVVGAANKTINKLPTAASPDLYLTYYQALGLFQTGVKKEWWKKFNPEMKTSLLSTQVKTGTFEENKGSWNPEGDKHGKDWSRVGETAIAALSLEIYYRYKEIAK